MQTLHDWYRYLERQMHVSLFQPRPASSVEAIPRAGVAFAEPAASLRGNPAPPGARLGPVTGERLRGRGRSTMPGDGASVRRGGRRRITETRDEIVRRLLDPELALYEAAAVLNLSKATVRRYTDQGKLPCVRTGGGQRRFRLSALLAFLDRRDPQGAQA
jgi:excisionase family DNA binding protein